MGVSPPRGSHAALPIACDALNARTVAVREYHYFGLCVFARKPPHSHYGVVLVARSENRGRGAPAARLGINRTYPICPILRRRYLPRFLYQGAKAERRLRHRKGASCFGSPELLCPEREDGPHQFGLQAVFDVLVYAQYLLRASSQSLRNDRLAM
jgi:hypothetical protein